ncbi:MAG: hypothetical protein QOF73_4503, partial [Thermomicrobiales bacterium]|nr:hypothetical protein [Thermomicrobiales bacterium]
PPCREAGCNVKAFRALSERETFQAPPCREAGCNPAIPRQSSTVHVFQSPPCREAGCNGANSWQISLSRRLSGAFSSRRAVGNSTITRVPGLSEPSRCANLTRGRRERRVRAMSARLGSPITRPTPTARRCSPIIAETSTGARGGAASRRSLPPFSPTCSINRLGFYRSRRAGTTRARTALGKPAGSVWRVTPCEGNEFESLSGSC